MKKYLIKIGAMLLLAVLALSLYSCKKDESSGTHEHFFKTYVYNNDALPGKNGTKTAKCEECGETKTVVAEGTAKEFTSGMTYELSDDESCYTLTSVGTAKAEEVIIPYEISGLPVTAIGEEAFRDCKTARSVAIPDIVTDIGARAFYNCTKLENINIPEGIETIKEETFRGCSSIVKITLPESLKTIENYAFFSCTRLISIIIPENVANIAEYSFWGCYKLFEVFDRSALNIANDGSNGYVGFYAMNIYTPDEGKSKTFMDEAGYIFFDDAEAAYLVGYVGDEKELVLPENCNGKNYIINSFAFSGNTEIISLTMLEGVRAILDSAFINCSNIKSITFGSCLRMLEANSFAGCTKIEAINYIGMSSEWSELLKEEGWDKSTGSYTVYCTDATVKKSAK